MLRRFGDDTFRVTGSPQASALSANGARLAVLSYAVGRKQVLLQILDTRTGRHVCRGSVEAVGLFTPPRLAFSPDGKYVAAMIAPEVRVVWATDTGQVATTLPGESAFSLCQFTPDGLLAVTGEDHTDLYAIPAGKVVKTWPVGPIARLTADGKTFVRVEREFDNVSIGATATGAMAGTLPVKAANYGGDPGLAFSADGRSLAVIHDGKEIQLWDTVTRRRLGTTEIPEGVILPGDPHDTLAFAPDGLTLALETRRGEIHRWDTRTLAPLPTLRAPWASSIRGVHWSKDGQRIQAVADNGLVHHWEAKTGQRLPHSGYNGRIHFAVLPGGSRLVIGDHAGRLDVWDVNTGKVVRQLDPGRDLGGALVCLAASPDGRVAVGDGGGGVRLFRGDGEEEKALIPKDPGRFRPWFTFLAWAPDGKSVYTGDADGLRRLNASGGKPVWESAARGVDAALSPDGRLIAVVQRDRLTLLDAATAGEAATFRVSMAAPLAEGQSPLRALAFAPDGKQLALAVGQNEVVLCDLAGREVRRFAAADRRHLPSKLARALQQQMPHRLDQRVEALAWTPDGKWLVSGAEDQAVRVWEAATGKLVLRLEGHDSGVEQVAVAPDGRSAFSASRDGFVCQWDLTPRPLGRLKQKPDNLWDTAAEADPAVAVPAVWALVQRSAELRAFVAQKLPSARVPPREQLAKWVEALDAAEFTEREAASKALAAQGRLAEPLLREALQKGSAEVRRRAGELLEAFEHTFTPEELRTLRLVQACEFAGTPSARALLRQWAGGAPEAMLTQDAKAALARLERRSP
jgi:WD40 repeat protein